MFNQTKKNTNKFDYENIQDFIRELIREELFEDRLTPKEIELAKKIERVSDEHNLYVGFDEIKKILKEKREDASRKRKLSKTS